VTEAFFRDALDALIGFLPDDLGAFEARVHGRGLKVWFGDEKREHYEAQEVGRYAHGTDEGFGHAIEIGFHAEHGDPARNADVVDHLLAQEKRWRKLLGKQAEAGFFVGDQSKTWQRVSEFWTGPEIDEPDAAIEAADRLATYIAALEPVRRTRPTRAG
jgi:hypothetical protein